MKLTHLEFTTVKLPFRFGFKHSLANRFSSYNIVGTAVVSAATKGDFTGFGESVPRAYVTGETTEEAISRIRYQYVPRLVGREFANFAEISRILADEFKALGLAGANYGASWCALEIAVLDAVARASNRSLVGCLSEVTKSKKVDSVIYGGVVPICRSNTFKAVLWGYRLYGLKTVKVKVGGEIGDDLERLRIARSILGSEIILRVDANSAWTAEETIKFARQAEKYNVASIEQPVPADDIAALERISGSISQELVVDESLCTISQAQALAQGNICGGFNIRLSKVGGILAAARIVEIARQAGITCHLGAQVGESGILSAAGRAFASVYGPFANCEGSANFFLLKGDLTNENLNYGYGGLGKLLKGTGLGVNVEPVRLKQLSVISSEAPEAPLAPSDLAVRS